MIDQISKYWHSNGHFNYDQRDFFIQILSTLKPKNVLEIGFATGRSCCTTLIAGKPLKMICLDLNLDYLKGGRQQSELLQKDFSCLKILEGDSIKILNNNFIQREFPEGLDFIYVDGGHQFDQAFHDISTSFPFLNNNGIMIIDDFYSGPPNGCSISSVNDAVEKFASLKRFLK